MNDLRVNTLKGEMHFAETPERRNKRISEEELQAKLKMEEMRNATKKISE